MPKNKKKKPRFSSSVTRSGRCFSVQHLSTAVQPLSNPIQTLADGLATSLPSEPISGIGSALNDSPVTPLFVSMADAERWKDVNPSSILESVSRPGNLQFGIGVDVLEGTNSDEPSVRTVNTSVGAMKDAHNDTVNVAVPLKPIANPIPLSVSNSKHSARQNASKNPVIHTTVHVNPDNSVGPSHATVMSKDSVINLASPSIHPIPSPLHGTPPKLHSNPSYASCFSTLPRCAGVYVPRIYSSSYENPIPPPDVIQEGSNFWKDHLVGFFLDSEVPYLDVRTHCRKAWNLRGGLNVNVVNGMFYFKFSIMEERRKVLESDPAIIGGKPFIITSWSATVESARQRVPSVPVWTIFTRIPSVLQTLPGLNWLASRIGNFKCFDTNTETRKNLIFAKALIEITPDNPLPKKLKVSIEGYDFYVDIQYSWQPEICTKCQSFGHLLDACKAVGPPMARSPLMKPPPGIWVRKKKVVDKLVDEEPSMEDHLKGEVSISLDELLKGKEAALNDSEVLTSEGVSEDDGMCWMSDDRAWVHEASGMRYDPCENEYYKYVSDLVEDARRLEYQIVGDSFELIQEGVLGEKNQSLFHDSSWDWNCEFRSPNSCFVPNLAVLFSEYINVIGSGSDSSSYSTLVGD